MHNQQEENYNFKYNKYIKNSLIDNYFKDDVYNSFKRFYKAKGLIKIGQLNARIIKQYRETKGIGVVRFEIVLARLQEISNQSEKSYLGDTIIEISTKLYEYIKDISIRDIAKHYFRCDFPVDTTIGEIQGKAIKDIVDLEKSDELYKLIKRINKLKTLDEIASLCMESLKEQEVAILKMRLDKELPLVQVAEMMELSSERIRQIEQRKILDIDKRFIKDNFFETLNLLLKESYIKDESDLRKYIGNKNILIISILRHKRFKRLEIESLKNVLPKSKKEIYTVLKKTVYKLPVKVKVEDAISIVDSLLNKNNVQVETYQIKILLRDFGYQEIEEYFYKESLLRKQLADKKYMSLNNIM